MTTRQFLLPLFYARKSTKNSINEKKLIFVLLISTVITLVLIIKNLPSNVSLGDANIKEIFIPVVNESKNNKIIHNDDHDHQKEIKQPVDDVVEQKPLEPPPPVQPDKPVDAVNEMRREKIKSVIALFSFI